MAQRTNENYNKRIHYTGIRILGNMSVLFIYININSDTRKYQILRQKVSVSFVNLGAKKLGPHPQTAAPSASAIVHVSAWDEKDSIPVRLATLRVLKLPF